MWDIETLVLDAFRAKSIQDYINRRYQDPTKSIFNRAFIGSIETVQMHDGNIFDASKDFNMIHDSYSDYDISHLRPNDIVLDIGANVGGFSLRAARKAKHVYAVEPLMGDYLKRNIALNDLDNITVLEYGLGETGSAEIEFHGAQKTCELHTLSELIELCGGYVNYLKTDCEGGEWCMGLHELTGIRVIAGELHEYGGHRINEFTRKLRACDMDYVLNPTTDPRCTTFNASVRGAI